MRLHTLVIAGRVLGRNPVFTAVAVLTIALGVGTSTAVFSVANAVLLRPLPYRDPGKLVIAGMELRQRNVKNLPFSNADFIDLREGTKSVFADMAGVFTGRLIAPRADGTPEQLRWAIVTTNFFSLSGARILYGRDFNADDGVPSPQPDPGAALGTGPPQLSQIAILSYEYFLRRFGGNQAIIGHTMQFSGRPGPVIAGVLAPGFRLYFPPDADEEAAPDIWMANRLAYNAFDRNGFSIRPVARLRDGVPLKRAQEVADTVAADGRKHFPIDQTAGYYIDLEPLQAHLIAAVKPAILTLMGSVVFLLLIACANVANLMLVRASLREPEFAVRASLGASRWKLIQPLLTEACLIAAAGSVLGLALAWAGIRELRVLAPANLPRLDAVGIDGTVLCFTALAGFAAAALFGIVPAWRASQASLMNVLRGASRTSGLAGGAALRNVVVIAEVALSFVLLIGSGLMLHSFQKLQQVDPGFDARHLLTFQILGVRAARNDPASRAVLIQQIAGKLGSLPGVESVTASYPFPLTGDFSPIRWGTEDAVKDPSKFQATDFQIVLPGYFETLRTPLLAGRTLTADDNLPGRSNVVVDDALARKAFPGQSAVGKRILIRLRTPEPEWVQIGGVVAHQHQDSLTAPGREQIYFPDAFLSSGVVRTWAVRTSLDPAQVANAARAAIAGVDRNLVFTEMETGDEILAGAQAQTRFSLLLIAIFALVAGTLAGVGLYGVLSTAVQQRTPEIGVRMALGADRADIVGMVVSSGMRLALVGIGAGALLAVLLGRAVQAMLVGVKPTDPVTFAATFVLFLVISGLASWAPARRAAALDPKTALHEQ
ncbi:MAG TPA: ABC transporter permease [Terracidiphilus sp.]|jgi:putative ABC transport system permease protein|nr:ABC transporter permease [Terracidiphilus sp.]